MIEEKWADMPGQLFIAQCDKPVKRWKELCVPLETSIGELKSQVARVLDIEPSAMDRYEYYCQAMGRDVIMLRDLDPQVSIAELPAKSTIYLSNKSVLNPRILPTKKPNVSSKGEEGKNDRHKYKGMTPKIALKMLRVSKGAKKQLAASYVDIYCQDVTKEPSFLTLPESVLLSILRSDSLNINEVDLFEACVSWGRAAVQASGEVAVTQDDLKHALRNVLQLIRFPAMDGSGLATRVKPTGLLSRDQLLDLFTYVGMRGMNTKQKVSLGRHIRMFNSTPRKGKKRPGWFKWDPDKKHERLMVSPDGLTCTSTSTSNYQQVFGDVVLDQGVWEWEIVLQMLYKNSYACNIGVVPAQFTNWTNAHMIGYPGHTPGWAFAAGHGLKYHLSQEAYGHKCTSGDVVRIRLDCDNKTLEYSINGDSLGVAFADIVTPVRPAMSLYGNNSVLLRFPK